MLPKLLVSLYSKPLCPSYAFDASRRKAYHTKDTYCAIKKLSHDYSGSLVSVDQLVSTQPGLVPQSSGYLSASRIWACAVFVDSFSSYGFRFMMQNTSLEQTVQEKVAFERELSKHNMLECRVDNDRFADIGFKDEIEKCN